MGTTTYKKIDISEEGQKCWKTDSSWNTINVNQSNAVLAINMAHYMAHYSKTKKKNEKRRKYATRDSEEEDKQSGARAGGDPPELVTQG